jgi:hypothetical protein
MEGSRRKAVADAAVEISGFLAALLVVGLLYAVTHHQTNSEVKNPQPQAADGAVDVPGTTGYTYTPGLAAQFGDSSSASACQKWQKLAESQKYGLAFVAPKSVPGCAEPRYVQEAGQTHAGRLHKGYRWDNHTEFFDLGTPAFASYFDPSDKQQRYTCSYLTKLVAHNYVTDPMPKSEDPYIQTAADRKAFDKWWNEVEWVNQIFTMYAEGGKFDPGCYPPGVMFGKDDSITFYPNVPVKSLAETPAPVFIGQDRCNVCFRGPVYRVKSGDTLGKLATCFYGAQWYSYDIQDNNNLSDRDVTFLQIGQKLYLPNKKRLGHCVKPIN